MNVTRRARYDLIRLREFIAEKNPQAAQRAAERITTAIDQLATFPLLGRACPEEYLPAEFRELVISFGQDGYVVLYRVDIPADTLTIVAMRHQREAGFEGQGGEIG
ncbi:MAG: type II toxin-antitoxin system RelE/ParE family toxin [Candidatus Thiothrix singaporensis]|uniref:Type II toxin-antitoxin system RelE/ParE family toxin n=1 Tax=Candidatus Thiothrix singaporensis TaxID=2799669 RepID=A0A7L6AYS8_9GAMM|nr:MAG: type II toxin-antitoxin system RelE/ParE family toxin [Candidatus Thiothrix singaporensis]